MTHRRSIRPRAHHLGNAFRATSKRASRHVVPLLRGYTCVRGEVRPWRVRGVVRGKAVVPSQGVRGCPWRVRGVLVEGGVHGGVRGGCEVAGTREGTVDALAPRAVHERRVVAREALESALGLLALRLGRRAGPLR